VRFDVDLDLRGEVCPYVFIKARLMLEDMAPGKVLRCVTDYPPAAQNVPKNFSTIGEEVLSVRQRDESTWEIYVKKRG